MMKSLARLTAFAIAMLMSVPAIAAVGGLNPKDNTHATTTRPSETNSGAAARRWYSDSLRTIPHDADLNRIIAQIRNCWDTYLITDVEGDDTLLSQCIHAAVVAYAQPLDGDLTALAGLSTTGIPKRTGTNAWSQVAAPSGAIVGTTDTQALTGKSIDGGANTLTNIPNSALAAAVPLLGGANTYSASQTFQGTNNIIVGAIAGAQTEEIDLRSAAGQNRRIRFQTGSTDRWYLMTNNSSESGNNAGSCFLFSAYNDAGTLAGNIFSACRGSGPQGNGNPYFTGGAGGTWNASKAGTPSDVAGFYFQWNNTQPTSTLGSNPITPNNGLTTAKIAWTGHQMTTDAYLDITGATAICGQTLNGFYPVTAVNTANIVTVDTGQIASCGTAGGGAAVTVKPYFTMAGNREDWVVNDSAPGFHNGFTKYCRAEPDFYVTSNGPSYECDFSAAISPNDTSGTNAWSTTGWELDVSNRGTDQGYNPNPLTAFDQTQGLILVPVDLSQFSGSGTNVNTAARCGHDSAVSRRTGWYTKFYDCLVVRPDALVSQQGSVGGHGGVGYDAFGGLENLAVSAFATTNTSATVTVTYSDLANHGTPTKVYFPVGQTIRGAIIAANKWYTIGGLTSTTFTITADSVATSTGSGGAAGVQMGLDSEEPYAPTQISGSWYNGIDSTPAMFENGWLLKMNGSVGLDWTDGSHTLALTSSGTANGTLTLPSKTGMVATGPTSSTSGNLATYNDSTGGLADSGTALSSLASTGVLIGISAFQASGTWTPNAATKSAIADTCAAGGGSGGAVGSASNAALTGGAAGGSCARVLLTGAAIAAQTITIGAGGTAGDATGTDGGDGGTTTLGSLVSCPGGGHTAGNATAGTAVLVTVGGTAPLACTISGSGVADTKVKATGETGKAAIRLSGTVGLSGDGGASLFGGRGARGVATASAGVAGASQGSGASGAFSNSGTGKAGAVGADGQVTIYEYK